MVSRSVKTTALLLLGIGLLLNPLYLVPEDFDGSGTEFRYEVETVDRTDARAVVTDSERTLSCGTERACALERAIAEEGSIEYAFTAGSTDGETTWDPYRGGGERYEVVRIGEGFYVPEHSAGEDGTILSLREVSAWQALDRVAVPSERASAEARRAAERGSIALVDSRVPVFEQGNPIEHDGEYYHPVSRGTSDTVEYLFLARIFAFLGGAAFVATAWIYRGRR